MLILIACLSNLGHSTEICAEQAAAASEASLTRLDKLSSLRSTCRAHSITAAVPGPHVRDVELAEIQPPDLYTVIFC